MADMFIMWVVGLLWVAEVTLAGHNCPMFGQEFPFPQNLDTDMVFGKALQDLTGVLAGYDASVSGTPSEFSYSLQIFSTNPGPEVLWERFHTASNLQTFDTPGVTTVDQDSVYRLGSVTKVFTVFAFLAQDGDQHFNDPITNYVPELAMIRDAQLQNPDPLNDVDWDDVTIGALASQMAGIIRDYGVLGEVTQTLPPRQWQPAGFPPLSADEIPPCGAIPLCNRTQFFEGLSKVPASYKPWTTPAYSDIAFQILAYALETIAGKTYPEILNEKVLQPLNLSRTYYYPAPAEVGIIPGNISNGGWFGFLGDTTPSGGMFSSGRDMTKLGLGILRSTLMKPATTRRWLKPISYTSDMMAGVSSPWGTRRIHVPGPNPHRSVTAFTKAGRTKTHISILTLLPDWGLGFNILGAGNFSGSIGFDFLDFIGSLLIPAYDAAARNQAEATYGGRYVSEKDDDENSWLEITTDPAKPGLGVGTWLSNGTNMIVVGLQVAAGVRDPPIQPAVRLYYTQREVQAADKSRKQAFKAVFEEEGYPNRDQPMPFSTDCAMWLSQTGVTYGSLPLDEFVFHLDPQGQVTGVEIPALKAFLKKTSQAGE